MTNPVSNARRKPVGDDVRQRLLTAALELLQSQGFQALTQARVAEAAGMRQSHLTYYFRTRNDLLKAVVEEGASALVRMIGSDTRPGKVTLASFRDALLSVTNDQSMPRLLIALTVASDEDPALKAWLAEFDRGMQAHLATSFRQFGLKPSPIDLTLFHAALIGTSILSLQHTDAEWSNAARKIVRLAFDRLVANSRVLPSATRKAGRA
jgi:AcrR family transcriptional regulator